MKCQRIINAKATKSWVTLVIVENNMSYVKFLKSSGWVAFKRLVRVNR